MKTLLAFVALLILVPLAALAQSASPYAGQEQRTIKALSDAEIKAYLAGDGMGLAKAAELNHYPGPKHILEMADHLGLSAAQRAKIAAVEASMSTSAIPLGRQVVDAEAALEKRFADGTIDDASLRSMTQRIAELQGRLRAVHLAAHIATRAVLDAEQIAMYDSMRGYSDGSTKHMH
jgi:Spy/CpxP family protein refolding chaperone